MRWLVGFLCLSLACGGDDVISEDSSSMDASLPDGSSTADISSLSDEFSSRATLDWTRVYEFEGWQHDQLESWDVGSTRDGWLTLLPYTSSWYEDYRGVLLFRDMSGDFVVTTSLQVSNRAGDGPPAREYSLAGIMVRQPRNDTASTWTSGQENYVFLSLGAASNPGSYQTEVKTTVDGESTLEIADAASGEATIRVARIGNHIVCMLRPAGGSWTIHRRFQRSDFGASMQVGLTVYTDWENVETLTPSQHNTSIITDGSPDLQAQFDYVLFARPTAPDELQGSDLSDSSDVSDADLLAFLGDSLAAP